LGRRRLLEFGMQLAMFLNFRRRHMRFSTKKPFKLGRLEGLHPVYLALMSCFANFCPNAESWQQAKAGLLASPPFQRPSHPNQLKQWHRVAGRVPFSLCPKKAGLQRRDHSRFSRDSLF
jgi:hypothetical protein